MSSSAIGGTGPREQHAISIGTRDRPDYHIHLKADGNRVQHNPVSEKAYSRFPNSDHAAVRSIRRREIRQFKSPGAFPDPVDMAQTLGHVN